MAYNEATTNISRPAAVDLSAKANLFTAVKLNATGGVIKADTAGEAAFILTNDAKTGAAARLAVGGVTKAKVGAALAPMDPVAVRADATVGPATAGAAGEVNTVIGTALQAAAPGDIASILISPAGQAEHTV